MNKNITIRDVAKYAGVSTATVSYTLNGVKKVSQETKEKVMQAVQELGYQPDFTAISLSKKKSNLIGIMFPLVGDSLSALMKENPYHTELLSGIEMVARENNFDILITGLSKIEECKSWINKRNLDGLVLLGLFPKKLYNQLKELDIPTVLIDTYEDYTNIYPSVNINDELGGYLGTKHLIELGHENIAFVAKDIRNNPVEKKRYQGYQRALKEAKIRVDRNLIFESQLSQSRKSTFESGFIIGERILKSEVGITAIFSMSDILAIGIMKALNNNCMEVPGDFSLVGFDDISLSSFIIPGLTTVKQDISYKGKVAADTLIEAIDESELTAKKIELNVELVVRDSTKVKN